ncbi:hypothetical protein BpHYR1_050113 [Brachionus plicatilis]|uniref:Uncharacterized protein n=1 Tax=Brachionus plicatilis TaxID=10195 RepID=A0A3M7RCN7_BRAPC|nr:hypothetical protein BpHYR1_050113 [Brachionus plicatilis]
MFKPFDLFMEKKFPNEENAESLEEAENKWNSLDPSKKLKFIKKAEKKYDAYIQENPESHVTFSSLLSYRELEILFKSYGLPDKLQQNSKMYFFKIKQDEARKNLEDPSELESVLREVRFKADNDWKQFTDKEKHHLLKEFHQKVAQYNDLIFDFARNLPENRIVDYKEFCKRPEPTMKERNQKAPKKETIERFDRKFVPFDVYFDKHRDDFDQDDNMKAYNDARSKFKSLSDKKKLKYIKKAEFNYDEHYKNSDDERQLLSSYMNKNEMKLLLESYGMPDTVPNFSAYFFSKKTKEGISDMKQAFECLKKMNPEEKDEIQKEHAMKQDEYLLKKKQFLDSLPFSRLEDYNSMKKQTRRSFTHAGSASKKLKRNSSSTPNHIKKSMSDESEG